MTKRKLVAVLFTDIVGFSKNMSFDEKQTMELLEEHDRLLGSKITKFNGHILKHIGDAIFAEFPLVSDAVNCALKIQQALKKYNSDKDQWNQINIRIGIHMGEVIERDNDLFGDGVNIAARLESLARPGGICLSEDVFRSVKSTIKELPVLGGLVELKNIPEPITVYHYLPEGSNFKRVGRARHIIKIFVLLLFLVLILIFAKNFIWLNIEPNQSAQTTIFEPASNSIAVLAFRNMSSDQEHEYFSEGLSEEILNLLARVPSLKVTSRTSSFAYKYKSLKLTQIASELNVRFILEGSVRKSGDTIRVTAQLIDMETDTHIWSETYESTLTDILKIQDQIGEAIVGELKVIIGIELKQPKSSKVISTEVMENLWQGRYLVEKRTTESLAKAEEYFKAVTEAAPEFAEGWAGLARVTLWQGDHRYGNKDPELTIKLAENYADKAFSIDPNNDDVLSIKGQVFHDQGQYEQSVKYHLRAIELNPSNANVLIWIGGFYHRTGQYQKAIEFRQKALSINPLSTVARFSLIVNLLDLGRLKEAKERLDRFTQVEDDELQYLRAKIMYSLYTKQYAKALYYSERGRLKHPRLNFFTAQNLNLYADFRNMQKLKEIFDTLPSPFKDIQFFYTGDLERYIKVFANNKINMDEFEGFEIDMYHARIIDGRYEEALELTKGCQCLFKAVALQKLGRQKEANAVLNIVLDDINQRSKNGLVDINLDRIRYLIVSKQLIEAIQLLKEELDKGYILSSDFYLYEGLKPLRENHQWSTLVELSQKNIDKQLKIYHQLITEKPISN